MSENKSNFRHRILKLFDIFENVFALSFAIGLFLLTKEIYWAKAVLWTGIIGLTFIYLVKSFEAPKDKILSYITYKLVWLGYILALFGIYAKLELIEKSLILLYIAIGTLSVGLVSIILLGLKKKGIFDIKDIVRLVTFLIISFLFAII